MPRYLQNFDLQRLPQEKTAVLVVGSGIAGLSTAIKVAGRHQTLLVSKDDPDQCATSLAQGGVAVAMAEGDSPELHFQDTLAAGDGLCSREAVRLLVNEGPRLVRELVAWGVAFDREGELLALGQEGAHCRRRIVHRGDSTGAAIWQGLLAKAMVTPGLRICPGTMVLDLLVADGRCYGVLVRTPSGSLEAILAGATVLANGGAGQLYPGTTNPPVATGDGIAMAYRAGAEVTDLEFYQFHPTVLVYPGTRGILISEAVRGEGAVLRNRQGERFMPGYHPLAELAPRDVVCRAEMKEIERQGGGTVFLDLTHLPAKDIEERFPSLSATCRRLGVTPSRDWLPVAPAAHYFVGGVRTDLWGRTNLDSLYACGETACTGVHGANRLASNSLLEGLVFGNQVAEELLAMRIEDGVCPPLKFTGLKSRGQPSDRARAVITHSMKRWVGLTRDGQGLNRVGGALDLLWPLLSWSAATRLDAEDKNLLTLAYLIVAAATWRRESRGCHYRKDFSRSDEAFLKHLVLKNEGAREVCERAQFACSGGHSQGELAGGSW